MTHPDAIPCPDRCPECGGEMFSYPVRTQHREQIRWGRILWTYDAWRCRRCFLDLPLTAADAVKAGDAA